MQESARTENKVASATQSETKNGALADTNDTFDPRKLTLNQSYTDMVGVRKETLRVPIQRPPKQSFFMPHPDPDWRIQIAALELKEERETYILDPSVVEELTGEWVAKVLIPCQTKQGGLYLWPIRLPGSDGRSNSWSESAQHIANQYAGRWIRVTANMEVGAYDVVIPIVDPPSPTWPQSPDDILSKAFRGRVIDSLDHAVVRQLRGCA